MSDRSVYERLANLERLAEELNRRTFPIYDRGTYTPTYLGSGVAGVTNYNTQLGSWRRAGSLIFVTGTLIWVAATGTLNAQISLPFASANVAGQNFSGYARLINVTFAAGTPTIELAPNSSFFLLHSSATNGGGTYVQMEAAGNLIFSLFYFLN